LPGLSAGSTISEYLAPVGIPYDVELLLAPRDTSIVYRGEKQSADTLVCGTPVINVTVTPNADTWQLDAFVYSVDGLDIGRVISWATFTRWHDVSGTAGQPYRIENWQIRSLCTVVPAGSRIAVGFTMYNEFFMPANDLPGTNVAISYTDAVFAVPINPK
jgi:hypothetical protein